MVKRCGRKNWRQTWAVAAACDAAWAIRKQNWMEKVKFIRYFFKSIAKLVWIARQCSEDKPKLWLHKVSRASGNCERLLWEDKMSFYHLWTNSDKSNRYSPSVFCATYAACFAAACWFETAELAYPFGRQRKTCVEVFFFLNHNAEKSFRLLDQLNLAQSTVVHCLNYNPAVFCVEMTSYWPVHIAGVRARRVAQSRRFLRSLDGRWAGTRIRCTRSRLSCADDVIGHLMLAPRFSGGVLLRTHLICKVRVL